MAFRRFVNRRGCPKFCYSDNGTNFVAGEKELRESLLKLNQEQIENQMSQRGIVWKFNSPSSSAFWRSMGAFSEVGESRNEAGAP